MEEKTVYRNLRFDRRSWAFTHRSIPVILINAIFILIWMAIPQNALLWLLVPLVGVLAWMSTYGWRQALASLILFLNRLEKI